MKPLDPQEILWAVIDFMGQEFVQGCLDEFYETLNNGDPNRDLIALKSGLVMNWRTDIECTDDELRYFLDWCRDQNF